MLERRREFGSRVVVRRVYSSENGCKNIQKLVRRVQNEQQRVIKSSSACCAVHMFVLFNSWLRSRARVGEDGSSVGGLHRLESIADQTNSRGGVRVRRVVWIRNNSFLTRTEPP